MNTARSMIGALAGVGMLAGSFAAERERRSVPEIEVVLSIDDGLPEVMRSGHEYVAEMHVAWSDRVRPADGLVSVYVSRRDGGVASDTGEHWPLACATRPERTTDQFLMTCAFEAPSPGTFALLLEVSNEDGTVVAEGLYSHEIES